MSEESSHIPDEYTRLFETLPEKQGRKVEEGELKSIWVQE